MKSICFYFQVHQPFRYRRYRFFDIGNDHYYYDDYANESILRKVADRCYLPANKLMLELIKSTKVNLKLPIPFQGWRSNSLNFMPLKYWIPSRLWPIPVMSNFYLKPIPIHWFL